MKKLLSLSFILWGTLLPTIAQTIAEKFKTCEAYVAKLPHPIDSTQKVTPLPTLTHNQEFQKCLINAQLPDLQLVTTKNKVINFAELKGKVVVINCWFYGCAPCIAEIPALNQLVQKYENQAVEFIALTRDSKEALAKYFFPKYNFKFQIVTDADSIIQEELKMLWGYPTTMIFDKTGKLQHIVSGGFMGNDVIEKTLQKLIPLIDEGLK